MELLSNDELNSYCIAILQRVRRNRIYYYPCALVQYAYGCRSAELFKRENWGVSRNETPTLQNLKKGALRSLNISLIEDFEPFLEGHLTHIDKYCTLATYRLIVHREVCRLGLYATTQGKARYCATHIFRHNYAKQMHLQGMDRTAIAAQLGEKKVDSIDFYLGSEFYIATK